MALYSPHRMVLPEYPNAANGPGDFQAFAASIEANLVGIAVDEADRDTRYADIPVGGLVSCMARRALWQRTENGWYTLVGSRVVSTGFVNQTGFEVDYLSALVENERVCVLNLRLTRTGETITAPGNGNIGNTPACTLPSELRPNVAKSMQFRSVSTSGGALIGAGGGIQITDMNPNSVIEQDSYIDFDATYRLLSGV